MPPNTDTSIMKSCLCQTYVLDIPNIWTFFNHAEMLVSVQHSSPQVEI